ncbi:MAG TPA: hypothetical protein VD790_06745 [Thermoleophilaceae bacterium]|nr:hypothetical protein [Thermoleophilaceae bacterium]
MISKVVGALALTILLLVPASASAQRIDRVPTPELDPLGLDISPRPCSYEGGDEFEKQFYKAEGWKGPDYTRYPGACQRMRFSYGPIAVKPGQNDVLINPVTIEKPMADGYITRFRPNLVRADGTVPPVEQVHLHHGTWISYPEYGSGPFFAAGEEKTVAPFPHGFGMPVKATDTWLLLYMVHSAVVQPMEVYIIYDVDFIPKAQGDDLGMKSAYPLWLDVRPSGYPVFNTQRQFGGKDDKCTWPREQCADFDPYGKQIVGQGEPGNGKGEDWTFPEKGETFGRAGPFNGGTIIGMGGHMHPGGIQNEIDLVRGKKKKRIYTGKAVYWNPKNKKKGGGPKDSWDFSMPVVGNPFWGVHVKPGDKLRSNVTYDTKLQSTYENMGIAVSLLVPNDENGKPQAPGLNPFKAKVDRSRNCYRKGGLKKSGIQKKKKVLCTQGVVTHGHLAENANRGGPSGKWDATSFGETNEVAIADFLYVPGDLSTRTSMGIPEVKLGESVRFTNFEGGAIYHTITSCAYPCLGQTGAAFPLADGETSKGRQVDLDSSELGFGTPAIGPAKQTLEWSVDVTKEQGYKPGEVVTYFCRIHPFMRGAFEVKE